jgi:hypothetical protein
MRSVTLLPDSHARLTATRSRSTSSLPWAVEFRYDDTLDEQLDRTTACETVRQVRAWVDGLLDDGDEVQAGGA